MLKSDLNEPLDAVFISDLHLHPDEHDIRTCFDAFLDWVALHTQKLYILGDFFHVWAGDDSLDAFSLNIAKRLNHLAQIGVEIFFMPGNRDFLLGKKFAKLAGFTLIKEPYILNLDEPVLLAHGDGYCTKDRGHYWFRKLTRNAIFPTLFLNLPLFLRKCLTMKVRERSKAKRYKDFAMLDIVPDIMLKEMDLKNTKILIHGHTHKPMLRNYSYNNKKYREYVLSDWDKKPTVLCYNKTKGLFLKRFEGCVHDN